MCASRYRLNAAVSLVAGLTLLAGCEGTFTNDLATHAPADPAIAEVRVSLLGLEFELSGGGTRTLDFRDGEPADLMDLVDGDPLRMFTDETLDAGDYTGVRLLFDEDFDAIVVDTEGGEFPLTLQDGAFADVNFAVADDERSSDAYTLTLDLRQSLAFDDANDGFTLTPALRAVKSNRTADLSGRVTVECPDDEPLERDGAVYLFTGRDVVPDDIDGAAPEPYATAQVAPGTTNDEVRYAVRNVEPGDYTVAATCRGADEELGQDDDLRFRGARNVGLDADETLEVDLE
jgi:hypothetical protein